MKAVEYLVNELVKYGVSDAFGIPGGVILDLLYELNDNSAITPHLSYHEQAAVFAASGYAQVQGTLGAAYVTRGPGLTNTVTPIADAYSESTPIVLITGHSNMSLECSTRFPADQEVDANMLFGKITKYVARIDQIENFVSEVNIALKRAMEGRKGPVLIDVLSSIWKKDLPCFQAENVIASAESVSQCDLIYVVQKLRNAQRPVILVGDGVRQSNTVEQIEEFSTINMIPVLSSRCGTDSGASSKYYYGYIGSHGIRYSNAILSKADVVLSLGNRLSFPQNSISYHFISENIEVIQVDIDKHELEKNKGRKTICADLKEFMQALGTMSCERSDPLKWIKVCGQLKSTLRVYDLNDITMRLGLLISSFDKDTVIVNDVGNNEFWSSRAYVEQNKAQRLMFSKTFGALGCSIPKAIGAYYRIKKPVLCITGDQGFQINSQELNYISYNDVKVCIVVINNRASGMIRDREKIKKYQKYVHTTEESGYRAVDLNKIATAYNLKYYQMQAISSKINEMLQLPCIVELPETDDELIPSLSIGSRIFDMNPRLPKNMIDLIEQM